LDIQNREKIYQLLRDAYFGDGQFEGGGALVKHERESAGNYVKRRALAYYLNYTGPIVNASVDPIFRNEIKREYNDTAKFKMFLDDADRTGADLQNYIRRLAVMAKLYGVVYVVVNNEAELGGMMLGDSTYEYIKRNVDAVTYREIRKLDIYGIEWESVFEREYPNGNVATPVIYLLWKASRALYVHRIDVILFINDAWRLFGGLSEPGLLDGVKNAVETFQELLPDEARQRATDYLYAVGLDESFADRVPRRPPQQRPVGAGTLTKPH